MATLTIDVPDKEMIFVSQLIEKLGGKVVRVDDKVLTVRKKALAKLEEGLLDVKSIREGKSVGLTIDDIFK